MMPSAAALWKVLAIISSTYLIFLHLTTNSYSPIVSTANRAQQPLSSNTTDHSSGIPKKIWQTWHTPAVLLKDVDKQRVRTWQEQNSGYRYELLTDAAAENFVREHYTSEESKWIGDIYLELTDKILKADFLRYLVLYASGGVRTPIFSSFLSLPLLAPELADHSVRSSSTQISTRPASHPSIPGPLLTCCNVLM